MRTANLTIGYLGEAIAKEYLENQGYKIIKQNYKTKYAEIDLIAYDKKTLVFIEVKTKSGEQFGIPEDALGYPKTRKLTRNALAYVTHAGYVKGYRIDAVCIVLDQNNNPKRISHYKNITL